MNASNVLAIDSVDSSQLVSAQSINTLIRFANALANAQAANGLSLQFCADRVIVGISNQNAPQANVDAIASTTGDTFDEIDCVAIGGEIDPDTFNAVVDIANAFANIEAGQGVSICKSNSSIVLTMLTNKNDPGLTVGKIDNASYTRGFISANEYNGVARIFNCLIASHGQDGIEFHLSGSNLVFCLSSDGVKKIDEMDRTIGDFCAIPNFTSAIGLTVTLPDAGPGVEQFAESVHVSFAGTPECTYTFNVTVESNLSAATNFFKAPDVEIWGFNFDSIGQFILIQQSVSGGMPGSMAIQTTTYTISLTGDSYFALKLENFFTGDSPAITGCYAKITNVVFVESSRA